MKSDQRTAFNAIFYVDIKLSGGFSQKIKQIILCPLRQSHRSDLKIQISILIKKGLKPEEIHISVPYDLMGAGRIVFVVDMHLSYTLPVFLKKSEILLVDSIP